MEANNCGVHHLDADALLPPRKRLLAGLKRQSSDVNSPALPTCNTVDTEYEARLNNLLKSRINLSDLSKEEIVETSKSAAIEAVKFAEVARAKAEIKAATAVRAIAAAKIALDVVATLSEEAADKEKLVRKTKMKKHVTVEALYNKNEENTNSRRSDSELARKLHQTINSSPRVLKNSTDSDTKSQKYKRLKRSASSSLGRSSIRTAVPPVEEKGHFSTPPELNSETPVKQIDMIMVDLNAVKSKTDDGMTSITDQLKLEYREAEVPSTESLDNSGKKRGRMKQKKLPLSICNIRDQTNPKDDLHLHQQSSDNTGTEPSLLTDTPAKSLLNIEGTSTWKCQAFKQPACVTQNKVMQS